MSSRRLEDLHPRVRAMCEAHIAACRAAGIDIIITSTLRTMEEQAALYAQGRSTPGRKVTNAKPGQSFHNYGLAYDVVPLRAGKPVWGTIGPDLALWQRVGALGKAQGLEWAGDWVRFKEFPHFQWTGGLTLKDLQAGKRP
jgi:peptidoglycan L-alanyl-D-glutamate endopeptidase CwlK